MTKTQIETYEMCKKHLSDIEDYIKRLPYGIQKYGCGHGSPSIMFTLDNLHAEMYKSTELAINKAKKEIQSIIDTL